MSSRTTYEGTSLRVVYDAKLCINAAECGRSAGELFVGGRDPWCDPDAAPPAEVVEVIVRCPTGALTFEATPHAGADVPRREPIPEHNVVVVSPHGPLYLRGDIELEGVDQGVSTRMALCRCGASSNKPFCDNSHEEITFRDAGPVGQRGKGLENRGGTLTIKRSKNGPLLLSGNVTIRAGSGRDAWEGTKCALCRCGGSKNKPFCDGTHTQIGFQAD